MEKKINTTIGRLEEMEEEECELPPQTHEDDIELKEGEFVRRILVRIKLLPDND